MVRFRTEDMQNLITSVERKWNASIDDTPIDISFMEDDLQRQYLQEQRLGGSPE
jgi:hypothetical protein